MSIEMSAQCFVCHMGHQVDAARALGDEETALAFSKQLLELYLDIPAGSHSSWLSPRTAKLFQKYYDVGPDWMWKEKKESNEFVRSKLEEIRAKVNTAADPLFAAIRFSILGNYLDFSALYGEVSFDKLDEMLDNALNMPLDEVCYEKLRQDLAKGKKLLYLTDNAGEIGFDRILGEVIHQQYPDLEITFCVRGAPVLNDATRADAEFMGIPSGNIFVSEIGKVLELSYKGAKFNGSVSSGRVLVDGSGVGDIGSVVLRDRKHLAEDGLVVVVATVDLSEGEIISGPDIVSRGFVYVKESEELMIGAKRVAAQTLERALARGIYDFSQMKMLIRDDLSKFITKETKRKPMILPVIMDK